MRLFIFIILLVQCFNNLCVGELSSEKREKYLNGFIDFLNSLPNQAYAYEDGVILNADDSTNNGCKIEARIRANDLHNLDTFKYVKCTATVRDAGDNDVTIEGHQCADEAEESPTPGGIEEVVTEVPNETPVEHVPVKLDNEVQTDTAVTSGEQFIAVPSGQGSAPCIGCSSPVNPEAAGVPELAAIGVTQLNALERNVVHALNKVVSVERQVQVVNGVRYILTLLVDYNSCSTEVTEACVVTKPCKISVLEKPWVKLPDGSKYRTVVSNNCTNYWIFRDQEGLANSTKNDDDKTGSVDDIVSFVHNKELQSQPSLVKDLTDEDIKKIQEQIISHNQFQQSLRNPNEQKPRNENTNTVPLNQKDHTNVEVADHLGKNSESVLSNDLYQHENHVVPSGLAADKKKTIDDLMNFFDFSSFNPNPEDQQNTHRIKRSYRNDLKVFHLAEKYSDMKKRVKNVKYLYTLANAMVDHMNEIDMETKSRTVKTVLSADEEPDVAQHFYYLQILVDIPCQKSECDSKDKLEKICSGVIDCTQERNPQVLNVFCYNNEKNQTKWGKSYKVPVNDPILQKMAVSALKKIESESPNDNALKLIKIMYANTQKLHGILTRITVLVGYTKCMKTDSFSKRTNCTIERDMGSKICDIEILQRKWIKENKVNYACTERPISESFVDSKKALKHADDRSVQEIVQEALQILEVQSNRNNKQKLVEIRSVTTQLVAGLLTSIDFTAGYTTCTNELYEDIERCKLIEAEPLRACQAQVWYRPWLEDGRQMNVSCNSTDTKLVEQYELPDQDKIELSRSKRSVESKTTNDKEYIKGNRKRLGGQTDLDPNDPKYLALAKESLQKYLQTTGSTQPHSVVKVNNVTTQVVSGTLTKIDFTVKAGNCDVIQCHSKVWEQSWLNKKEIDVNCDIENQGKREKREFVAGGKMEQDPNKSEYLALAKESLQKYLQTTGKTELHSVTKVNKVTTQVVSGSLTEVDFTVKSGDSDVIRCHSKVWEQPWLNKKEIDVVCNIENQDKREKRGVPGGETDLDLNDPKYLALAEESLQKYLQTTGSTQPHSVTKVNKVTTQVVSGTLTKIDFTVKAGHSDVIQCLSKVWEQPWLNKKEIDVVCNVENQGKREKRQSYTGGRTEQDPNKSKYLALAKESLQKYLQTTGSTQPHSVVKVNNVTTQVVSGTLTKIDFTVKAGNSDVIQCHSKVWEQSWLNKKEIDVNCDIKNQGKREKREFVAGGKMEQDPNKSEYLALAEESLQKYLQTTGKTEPHSVTKVNKVTSQVVSGSLTEVDFTVKAGNSDVIQCLSKVREQPWLNKKEINVDCRIESQDKREKRALLAGGQVEQDPNKSEYLALAEESLQKYLQSTGSTQPHSVTKVNKVTTQVVSGSLTEVDFTVKAGNSDVIQCHSKVWEQSWLNKKEIDVVCNIENQDKREKRGVPGGETDLDPNDPKYLALAEESLQKYLQTAGSTQPHSVTKVNKVTTQVVSGTLTKIDFTVKAGNSVVIQCLSKVWEQPWLNKKEINVDCSIKTQDKIEKRALLAGGQIEQDPNKSEYLVLAEESLQKYLQTTGSTQPHSVTKVNKVTTQVVSGSLTEVDFTVKAGNSDVIQCLSKVWEQPWLNKKEIDVVCNIVNQDKREKRGVPGGETDLDPNDPKYLAVAEESLQKYLQTTGSTQPHSVTKVNKVTTQVVSGTLTKIDFTVKAGNSDVIQCHSKVWEQSWLNKKEIDVNCDIKNQGKREKREFVAGGKMEQDPNKSEYLALAEESLQKYLQTTGKTEPHSVTKVNKVTTQVVSGSLTEVDFTVKSGDSDVIRCHSKVWEQEWLNKKDITVKCQIENERAKRQADDRVSGGPLEQDHTLPEYFDLAETCLRVYLKDKNITQHHKVIKVKEVTTQVVAGVLTRLVFVVSPTDCQINGEGLPTTDTCNVLDETDTKRCFAKVWDKSWLSYRTISVDCKFSRNKREIIGSRFKTHNHRLISKMGSEIEQDPNKEEYKVLAAESLRKYEKLEKSDIVHTVLEVKRVLTKLVSGTIYKIDFTATPTKCSKKALNTTSCEQINNNETVYCHSEVWDRPWLKRKDIKVDCNIENENENMDVEVVVHEDKEARSRRGLLGGMSSQDPTAERFKNMANVAIRQYEASGKTKYVLKVVKIDEVKEQIVDGSLVILKFIVSPTTCLLKDYIAHVEKCPINDSKIKLQCIAHVQELLALEFDEDTIKVSCKNKNSKNAERHKREIGDREKRQNKLYDDDELDEETKYYYADQVVQNLNQFSSTHNMQKIISIHSVQRSMHMKVPMVRMYVETAYTFCLRDEHEKDLSLCDELDGMGHRLCLAKLFPAADDELVIHKIHTVCDDDTDFTRVTGLSIPDLITLSLEELQKSPNIKYKLVHQGEPNVAPSLDKNVPVKMHFIVASTNCTKGMQPKRDKVACFIDTTRPAKSCVSYIWIVPNSRIISNIKVKCNDPGRYRRSVTDLSTSTKSEKARIQQLVQESLEKLEMSSLHRYKQRALTINSYSTKITTGKVTTIDFDVGYTNCLKYEWIDNVTRCDFLEHLPRRHCVSEIWERLWLNNGRNIEVNCEDDETPLESRIEFESAETAMQLAKHSLKHIEAKYPHPKKQQVVRIFSLEKQAVAGLHFRMKLEVGFTNCTALSAERECTLVNDGNMNRFCRVNVWLRPWTDHPPIYRVSCDYQDGASTELYHHIQAEQLFYNFLTTYKPDYVNDHVEMSKRFEIFKANVKKIHELNIYELGTATYTVNRFADLSQEEFASKYLGLKPSLRDENQVPMPEAKIPKVDVPEAFDWRTYGAVTAVKDQGSCGSCWAFSVTGNIEGQWKIQTGDLVSLSEQELVDCDKLDNGCNGGLPDNAYRAIEQLGGLETENDYPYEGEDDKCTYNKTLSKVHISGAVNISSNETEMAQWLVHNGPISIGINANAMQFYRAGVSHPWKVLCNPNNLDHGVLIVGFGVKDYPLFHKRLPYWIVKNSWGDSWGEEGYYRVYRGDGTCGVNKMASSAVI